MFGNCNLLFFKKDTYKFKLGDNKMNNQIPEKTNDNGVDNQVSKTVGTVQRLSKYRIISGIVQMTLAIWVALGLYNDNLNIVLLYVFEADCILRLVENILIRFTNK